MMGNIKWDGKAKGSSIGNRIFITLIENFGPLPAYVLLFFVSWHYVFFDQKAVSALRVFRNHLGFSTTYMWHLHKHFFAFGVALIDRVTFLLRKKHCFKFTLTNEDYLKNSLKKGNGAIIVSGHIGNWEIAGNYLYDLFQFSINIVMVDNEQEKIKNVFKKATTQRRFKIISLSHDGLDYMLQIKSALQNNEIVCFLGDRTIGTSQRAMPFLGELADFPTGPFKIAAITGAPIIPFFLIKNGFNTYCTNVFAPLYLHDLANQKRDWVINKGMKQYVQALECMVKKYPYQWFNFYDFWEKSKKD